MKVRLPQTSEEVRVDRDAYLDDLTTLLRPWLERAVDRYEQTGATAPPAEVLAERLTELIMDPEANTSELASLRDVWVRPRRLASARQPPYSSAETSSHGR